MTVFDNTNTPSHAPAALVSGASAADAARTVRVSVTPKQARFVDLYVTTGNASEAARQAGYSRHRSNSAAHRLLNLPHVKAAIAAIRAEIAERAAYTVEKCFTELGNAMEHARKTDNSSALVRAIELRGKLTGILVDRVDARVAVGMFTINVEGINRG